VNIIEGNSCYCVCACLRACAGVTRATSKEAVFEGTLFWARSSTWR